MQTEKPGPENPEVVRLPEPRVSGGRGFMECVKDRRSARKYRLEPLSLEELSEILWVAAGRTREYAGRGIRTPGCHAAPAAHNWQEVSLYVALQQGLYLYDAEHHQLVRVLQEDIRHLTAHEEQPFVRDVADEGVVEHHQLALEVDQSGQRVPPRGVAEIDPLDHLGQ